MRSCAICDSTQSVRLHRQEFLFPGQVTPIHYDVVACNTCGFVYADDIPEQKALNDFYQSAEHHLHAARVPEGLRVIHSDFFDFVRSHASITGASHILDVGCGMGHFLHHFKTAGFTRLKGLEPSPAAVRLAQDLYDIEVVSATVDDYRTTETYDLVSLCGVLEHIADLGTVIDRLSALLSEHGELFLAVPDAGTFGAAPPHEPFLEFALEHINFFTRTTLDELMRRHGFLPVQCETHWNDFYRNHYILGLYRRTNNATAEGERFDADGRGSVERYVQLSLQRLSETVARIEPLVTSQEPVVIWGAGSLTARLMCTTPLRQANIVAVIDRNPQLQGKQLGGVVIHPPADIAKYPEATVFIASTSYGREISEQLLTEHHWLGKTVSLPTNA